MKIIRELQVNRFERRIDHVNNAGDIEKFYLFGVNVSFENALPKNLYYLITQKERNISKYLKRNNVSNAYIVNSDGNEKLLCFDLYGISIFSFPDFKRERMINLRADDFNQYFQIEKELRENRTNLLETYLEEVRI